MRKNKKITDYVLSLSLFSFLTFALGGIMQLLSENDVVNEISLHYGRLPVLFGLSGIVFFFLIGNIRLYLQRRFTVSQSEYVVYLSDGRTDKRYVAFYDSGNRVYSRYGEKVVFVAPKVYEGLEKDTVADDEKAIFLTLNSFITSRRVNDESILFR